MNIATIDRSIIAFCRKYSVPAARFGLFVIFFWFGALKIAGVSPASPMVMELYYRTIPFGAFDGFMMLFGFFECVIGGLFLTKGLERVVIPLLALHMIATISPLFLIPDAVWTAPFVPTLEGQYIIKNLAVIALAVGIAAQLEPLHARK